MQEVEFGVLMAWLHSVSLLVMHKESCRFLASTGAQRVTIWVRPFGSSLSRALNLHLSGLEGTQGVIRKHWESNQSHIVGA